jgi:hypothetical protein
MDMKKTKIQTETLPNSPGVRGGEKPVVSQFKERVAHGLDLYQNRYTGWPGDTYPWRFPGSAQGRNPCHCDMYRRCFHPSFRGPLKIKISN